MNFLPKAPWLVSLRWLACVSVFAMIWLTSSVLGIVANPAPLYAVACAMVGYNLLFRLRQQDWRPARGTSTGTSSSRSPSTWWR